MSQDGGVPLVSKSWDGNTSDTQIFKERTEALLAAFTSSPTPRYWVADAKLYTEDTAATLAKLGFITRNSRRGLKCLNFNALFFELS